jgi:hypothetical protein
MLGAERRSDGLLQARRYDRAWLVVGRGH